MKSNDFLIQVILVCAFILGMINIPKLITIVTIIISFICITINSILVGIMIIALVMLIVINL